MPKKTETAATPKAPKKVATLTPEKLAVRVEDFPDGADAVRLLVQAALSGRQDLLSAALRRLMETAASAAPKKQGKPKATPAPAPQLPAVPLTAAQQLAEEDKIKAADLIRNLTQPAAPGEVLRDFVQGQMLPLYRGGQRVFSLKPFWRGRPLTSIRETWVQALQSVGIDSSRLVLQVAQGQLVVNLNGLGGR